MVLGMNSQKQIIALIKSISGQANVLTIPRVYINILKSHRAALFLSQAVYWTGKGASDDGWFYKSFAEWNRELGLNQHAVETCVKLLRSYNLIETKLDKEFSGIRVVTWYRVCMEKLADTIAESTLAETANVHKRKTIMSTTRHRLQQMAYANQNGTVSFSGVGYVTD